MLRMAQDQVVRTSRDPAPPPVASSYKTYPKDGNPFSTGLTVITTCLPSQFPDILPCRVKCKCLKNIYKKKLGNIKNIKTNPHPVQKYKQTIFNFR